MRRLWLDAAVPVLLLMPGIAAAVEEPQDVAASPSSQAASTQSSGKSKQTEAPKVQLSKEVRVELKDKLDKKSKEMESLKDRATTVTKSMAELAASGKITTSAQDVQTLKELVEQLDVIRKVLEKVQEEIGEIKGWIEGQNEALPIMANDILDLKKTKLGNYVQSQYRDTNQIGGASDAFALRRVRLGIKQAVGPQTSMKVSFDIATGTANNVAQLRDAFLKWDVKPSLESVGTELTFGQMPLYLGYELERSSSEREFPERAQYNRTMFAGERSRGLNGKQGIGENSYVHLGVWDALSYDDAEQKSVAPGPGSRLAMSGGFRTYGTNWDFGISGFFGERPSVKTTRVVNNVTETITHPALDREFLYIDGTYVGLLDPKMFIRFEAMEGKDRVPVTPGAQQSISAPRERVNMRGHQIHVGYNINSRNQINVRKEFWDPDTSIDGNVVSNLAFAYTYFINPGAKITMAHELINDPSRASLNQADYHITTLRVVFKF